MEENTDLQRKLIEWMESQEKELEEYADKHGIKNLDLDIIDEIGNIRNPLTLVRGKPITVEQTKQLITGEEPLFGEGNRPGESGNYDRRMHRSRALGDMFRDDIPPDTWIFSDGTIGRNFAFNKYPFWNEILCPYMYLAGKYPFLDMTISFTTIDWSCCYWCINWESDEKRREEMEKCKCRDCEPYWDKIMKYYDSEWGWREDGASHFEERYFRHWDSSHVRSDVGDFVKLTLWIHNGRTDVLFGKEAADKFKEYNALYCAPEYEFMFSGGLYWGKEVRICSREFVEECFEYIGKPKSLYDEYVEKKFLAPFPEGAVAVTKEWVIRQYNEFRERQGGRIRNLDCYNEIYASCLASDSQQIEKFLSMLSSWYIINGNKCLRGGKEYGKKQRWAGRN